MNYCKVHKKYMGERVPDLTCNGCAMTYMAKLAHKFRVIEELMELAGPWLEANYTDEALAYRKRYYELEQSYNAE